MEMDDLNRLLSEAEEVKAETEVKAVKDKQEQEDAAADSLEPDVDTQKVKKDVEDDTAAKGEDVKGAVVTEKQAYNEEVEPMEKPEIKKTEDAPEEVCPVGDAKEVKKSLEDDTAAKGEDVKEVVVTESAEDDEYEDLLEDYYESLNEGVLNAKKFENVLSYNGYVKNLFGSYNGDNKWEWEYFGPYANISGEVLYNKAMEKIRTNPEIRQLVEKATKSIEGVISGKEQLKTAKANKKNDKEGYKRAKEQFKADKTGAKVANKTIYKQILDLSLEIAKKYKDDFVMQSERQLSEQAGNPETEVTAAKGEDVKEVVVTEKQAYNEEVEPANTPDATTEKTPEVVKPETEVKAVKDMQDCENAENAEEVEGVTIAEDSRLNKENDLINYLMENFSEDEINSLLKEGWITRKFGTDRIRRSAKKIKKGTEKFNKRADKILDTDARKAARGAMNTVANNTGNIVTAKENAKKVADELNPREREIIKNATASSNDASLAALQGIADIKNAHDKSLKGDIVRTAAKTVKREQEHDAKKEAKFEEKHPDLATNKNIKEGFTEDNLEVEPEVAKAEEHYEDGVAQPINPVQTPAEEISNPEVLPSPEEKQLDDVLDDKVEETPKEEPSTYDLVTESLDEIISYLKESNDEDVKTVRSGVPSSELQSARGYALTKSQRFSSDYMIAKGSGTAKNTLTPLLLSLIPFVGVPAAAIVTALRQNNNMEKLASDKYAGIKKIVLNDPECKRILTKINNELKKDKPNTKLLKSLRKDFYAALRTATSKANDEKNLTEDTISVAEVDDIIFEDINLANTPDATTEKAPEVAEPETEIKAVKDMQDCENAKDAEDVKPVEIKENDEYLSVSDIVNIVTEAAKRCKAKGKPANNKNLCEEVSELVGNSEENSFDVDKVINSKDGAEMGTEKNKKEIEKADNLHKDAAGSTAPIKESAKYSSIKEACMLDEDYFTTDSYTCDTAEEKFSRLTEQVALLIARENNDPMYNELLKEAVYTKRLQEALCNKYHSAAEQKACKIAKKKTA